MCNIYDISLPLPRGHYDFTFTRKHSRRHHADNQRTVLWSDRFPSQSSSWRYFSPFLIYCFIRTNSAFSLITCKKNNSPFSINILNLKLGIFTWAFGSGSQCVSHCAFAALRDQDLGPEVGTKWHCVVASWLPSTDSLPHLPTRLPSV